MSPFEANNANTTKTKNNMKKANDFRQYPQLCFDKGRAIQKKPPVNISSQLRDRMVRENRIRLNI